MENWLMENWLMYKKDIEIQNLLISRNYWKYFWNWVYIDLEQMRKTAYNFKMKKWNIEIKKPYWCMIVVCYLSSPRVLEFYYGFIDKHIDGLYIDIFGRLWAESDKYIRRNERVVLHRKKNKTSGN